MPRAQLGAATNNPPHPNARRALRVKSAEFSTVEPRVTGLGDFFGAGLSRARGVQPGGCAQSFGSADSTLW